MQKEFKVTVTQSFITNKGKGHLILHPDDIPPGVLENGDGTFNILIDMYPDPGAKTYNENVINVFNSVIEFFPDHLRPDEKIKNKWLETIDKILRLDKVPAPELVKIIAWARKDKFWQSNFLSVLKLRRKNKDGTPYILVFNESRKKQQPTLLDAGQSNFNNGATDYLKL